MPSGNGITAARVRAGGPPTKMFTRNGLAARERGRVVHADAAVDLVVQADLAIRFVARRPRAARGTCRGSMRVCPGRFGILGVDLGQGDEGPAVVGPALELGQFADADLVGEERPTRDLARARAQ